MSFDNVTKYTHLSQSFCQLSKNQSFSRKCLSQQLFLLPEQTIGAEKWERWKEIGVISCSQSSTSVHEWKKRLSAEGNRIFFPHTKQQFN